MHIGTIVLFLATFLLWDCGYGEEFIYTWKDEKGVLNITDYAPPTGSEILDISPSHREKAEEYWRQRQLQQERMYQAEQQRKMEQQAAEAETYREADQLLERAEEKKEIAPPVKKKKGY
jgi:hypothetical protein